MHESVRQKLQDYFNGQTESIWQNPTLFYKKRKDNKLEIRGALNLVEDRKQSFPPRWETRQGMFLSLYNCTGTASQERR